MWGPAPVPRIGALRAAATRLTGLPAAVAAVRLDPSLDPTDPDALLRPTVAVRLTWHPALTVLATTAGAQTPTPTSYTLPAGSTGLAALAGAVHTHAWVDTEGGEVDPAQLAALLDVPQPASRASAGHLGPGRVVVARRGRTVTLCLAVDPVPAGPVVASATKAARCTPQQLTDVHKHLTAAGLVVVDTDTPGRFTDLGWLVDRRLVVHPAPGAPGWASVETGPLVTASLPGLLPAGDVLSGVTAARSSLPVAVDPLVSAAAAIARAGAAHIPVTGVAWRSWQEAFVGAYLASDLGLVNTLPPGSGKTACVAGAMATAAATSREHVGVVLAPATLLSQWAGELATFHPGAQVHTIVDRTDLSGLVRHGRPVVLLTSPGQVAADPGAWARVHPDDLAVDEGTWLRGDSATTRAVRAVRAGARRAVVLSGTADAHLPGTLESLVEFVTARTGLFTGPVEPALAGTAVAERCGPWVFGGGADVVAALPAAAAQVHPLSPGPVEQVVQRAAVALVSQALASARTPAQARAVATRLRTQVEGWRTGLACPAALLAGNSALATQLRQGVPEADQLDGDAVQLARTVPGLVGVKVAWTVARVAELVAAGEQVLVFADQPGALGVLADQLAGTAPAVRVGVLSGRVRPAARTKLVGAFTGGDLDVLAVAGVGQLGLNLQSAARVVHLDTPASTSSLLQRVARAARLGQQSGQVQVDVPQVDGTGEGIWWAHATGARASVDVLTLAGELTGRVPALAR